MNGKYVFSHLDKEWGQIILVSDRAATVIIYLTLTLTLIIEKRGKNEFKYKRVEICPCNRPWRLIEIRRKFHIF
jgi:hypothetical protein